MIERGASPVDDRPASVAPRHDAGSADLLSAGSIGTSIIPRMTPDETDYIAVQFNHESARAGSVAVAARDSPIDLLHDQVRRRHRPVRPRLVPVHLPQSSDRLARTAAHESARPLADGASQRQRVEPRLAGALTWHKRRRGAVTRRESWCLPTEREH